MLNKCIKSRKTGNYVEFVGKYQAGPRDAEDYFLCGGYTKSGGEDVWLTRNE